MSIALPDTRPTISLLGTTALLFEAPGSLDLAPQQRIWAMARVTEQWPEIRESVPGMNNLMLTFNVPPRHLSALTERLLQAWEASEPLPLEGRIIELPVVYGGEFGPHMADVIEHTGLDIETIAHLHSEPLYPVYALGSHPGYCYLGGMDPRIATPRRKVPVLSIGAGAVSIGGVQTGVSASAGPSGWNTIGRTEMVFFDPAQSPPALLQPGDLLRFRIERIIR
ncbi:MULTISPECIES: 5-oxoprolinase subunit PxpB [Pseudomonas]|uniref:5-oxoprolinase subunit PxpB n=1 Tax=Pseudomonas folii TaxID=2762593 RepID=A0ABR7AXB6_9PSED|nr:MULTISPECIES: 5-oxoprolinase subunit PxpB [Pseudomonas]MBC3949030.1 5-oxoprolinase subunit PxpB [Pseudomonas folii]